MDNSISYFSFVFTTHLSEMQTAPVFTESNIGKSYTRTALLSCLFLQISFYS